MSRKSKLFGDDSPESGTEGTDTGASEGADASSSSDAAAPLPSASSSTDPGGQPSSEPSNKGPELDASGRRVEPGNPPISAPKATEVPSLATSGPAPELKHPELEAYVAPAALHAAAPDLGDVERDAWGTRPTLDEIANAEAVLVRTVDERSAGIYVAGVLVRPTETEVMVQTVRDRGQSHLQALATDRQIEVKLVD